MLLEKLTFHVPKASNHSKNLNHLRLMLTGLFGWPNHQAFTWHSPKDPTPGLDSSSIPNLGMVHFIFFVPFMGVFRSARGLTSTFLVTQHHDKVMIYKGALYFSDKLYCCYILIIVLNVSRKVSLLTQFINMY